MKKLQSNGIKICLSLGVMIITILSCQKNTSSPAPAGSTGLSIHLTDDPSFVFDAVFIDITKLEVRAEDNSGEQEGEHHSGNDDGQDGGNNNGGADSSKGWITVDILPGVVNLLDFRNGADTLLGTGSFPAIQSLKQVRVTLGNNNSVTLNGTNFPLQINNSTIVINLDDASVSVSGDGQLHLWLDFDAGRSIQFNGSSFELNSSIKAFSKDKAGSIEGKVTPASAKAIVYAINGTDTSTAMPGNEGEFKIIGLKPGTYSLLVHPTANNYLDATVQGIVVTQNEDAHTGTIALHQ